MRNCPLCHQNKVMKDRVIKGYNLLKCRNCFFVFADIEKEENEKTNSGYDDKAVEAYEFNQNDFDFKWMGEIARRMTRKNGRGKVLDVGCGNGLLLSAFKDLGWDCHGVDLSPWSQRYAKKYGFKLFQGKIEELDLEKEGYDLVTSTSTLEHIYDPVPHIKRIVELIKPGGGGYFSGIPNYDSLSIRLGFSTFNCNHPPGHVNYFTPKTMRRAIQYADGRIKKAWIGTYGIPELHRLKKHINRTLKRKFAKEVKAQTTKTRPIKRENLPASLVVKTNYYLGKTFSSGDKIEVYLKK